MKRNIFETILAFVGLGLVYLGAGIDQCLHAQGQPAPNCHFTPLGSAIFNIGLVVGFLGIAPWNFNAKNYVCPVCGSEFGGGKGGKISETSHYQTSHPDFYRWNSRWGHWTELLVIFSFAYIIGAGQLISAVPSLSWATDLWALGFAGVCVAIVLDLVDMHFVTKRFRSKWLLVHPEGRSMDSFRVEPDKLSAGAPAWKQFTDGQERYFGGLMSGGLKKKGNFAGGYGIYFTSQRIVGVRPSKWFIVVLVVATLAGLGGGIAFGFLVGILASVGYWVAFPIILVIIAWGQRKLGFQNPMALEELNQRKDVEIRRDDMAKIDLKKPGAVRRGHLIITSKGGMSLKIMINQQPGVFDRVRGLVAGFSFVPPAEWIRDRPLPINYPPINRTDEEGVDDTKGSTAGSELVLDERHVEERDFAWCPHCATMIARGAVVCPNCGKPVNDR